MNATDPMRCGEWHRVRTRGRPDPSLSLLGAVTRFARIACAGMTDEAGHPAIEHSFRVMGSMASDDARIVAMLHDKVGTMASLRGLRALLPDRLWMAVATYEDSDAGLDGFSSQLIRADSLAHLVKFACLGDLTDPAQQSELDPFSRRRRTSDAQGALQALRTAIPNPPALHRPFLDNPARRRYSASEGANARRAAGDRTIPSHRTRHPHTRSLRDEFESSP